MAVRALVTPLFDTRAIGGGTRLSLDVASEWLSRGHEVHVICSDRERHLGPLTPFALSGALQVHAVSRAARLHLPHAADAEVERRSREILEQAQPDSVHLHNLHGLRSAALAAVEEAPTVYTALDFSLACPTGYLYDGTLTPCAGPEPTKCRGCVLRETAEEARRKFPGPARLGQAVLTPRSFAAVERLVTRPLAVGLAARMDRPELRQLAERRMARRAIGGSPPPPALLSRFDAIVVPAKATGDTLVRLGARGERVHVIDWGVRTRRASATRGRGTPVRLAFLGHPQEIKGFPFLAAALARLPDGLPLEVVAYAAPAFIVARQSRAVRRYLRVPTPRPVPLAGRFPDCDAVVVPSLWHENSPFAVLEALSNGVPVVASDQQGIRHVVRDGVNGLLLPPGDLEAWRDALLRIGREPHLLDTWAAACAYPRTPAAYCEDLESVIEAARAVRARGETATSLPALRTRLRDAGV